MRDSISPRAGDAGTDSAPLPKPTRSSLPKPGTRGTRRRWRMVAPMADWLGPDESRIGLGCMRLSTEPDRDPERAVGTIHAALDAGATVFDTARAYALEDGELGHNERVLARALSSHPLGRKARVVTKCGMRRPDGGWRADGRASSIAADCEESLRALRGTPMDMVVLHAPDPRVPFAP